MTVLGWIFMTASLLLVWVGTFWCFKKVLFPPHDEPHLPGGLGP